MEKVAMLYKLKCDKCDATCWVPGEDDPDTNSVELRPQTPTLPWENGEAECEHDDFTIVDEEYPDLD